MFFVNRDESIKQLQKIHQGKFYRAKRGAGKEWIMPIADNCIGLGKSEFGLHYIQKCRETWPDPTERDEFQQTLCACHTVAITFRKGDLLTDSFDDIVLDHLIDSLRPLLKVAPDLLNSNPTKTDRFLKSFTESVGPVFIVLDEIGAAFQDDKMTDIESRDKFMQFTGNIVGKWLSLKNVFFVLLGRGSFLSYVNRRPTAITVTPSTYSFTRLNIHLLRPEAIKTIINKTLISKTETKSIQEHCNLNEEQMTEVASHLFFETNGHPRTLHDALTSCDSYEKLLAYKSPNDILDWKSFCAEANRNKDQVIILLDNLEKESSVNLTTTFKDEGGKTISWDIIANNSFISWEGNVLKAKLYTRPFVKMYLEQYLMPLNDYLKLIASISGVSIDYPCVFEWMFIKRFQEMFSKNASKKPKNVLHDFFDTPIFGACDSLQFSNITQPIPKISNKGNTEPELDSATAHPNGWNALMDKIDSLGTVCLKPLPQSASSDGILISQVKFQDKETKLFLGLAIKNFNSTKFSPADLEQECMIFDRMFTKSQKSLNILIICCTGYSKKLEDAFKGNKYLVHDSGSYENIHEVILLDLSTPRNRARFFGFNDADPLATCIERVVEKSQVEYVQDV